MFVILCSGCLCGIVWWSYVLVCEGLCGVMRVCLVLVLVGGGLGVVV